MRLKKRTLLPIGNFLKKLKQRLSPSLLRKRPIILKIKTSYNAYLAKSAGHYTASRTAAHDDKVVLFVRHYSGHGTTTRVFDVALGSNENFQQAHEQHER